MQRQALIESFQGFCSSTVESRHLELARACIQAGDNHYEILPFGDLLERNRHIPNHLTTLGSAFDSIQKYVTNLLKPNRPPVWRSIKTNIPWYITHVGCIDGASDVLKKAGYSVETSDALEFPPDITEPDKAKLYVLIAELVMAKVEVEIMGTSRSSPRVQHSSELYPSGQHTGNARYINTPPFQANMSSTYQTEQVTDTSTYGAGRVTGNGAGRVTGNGAEGVTGNLIYEGGQPLRTGANPSSRYQEDRHHHPGSSQYDNQHGDHWQGSMSSQRDNQYQGDHRQGSVSGTQPSSMDRQIPCSLQPINNFQQDGYSVNRNALSSQPTSSSLHHQAPLSSQPTTVSYHQDVSGLYDVPSSSYSTAASLAPSAGLQDVPPSSSPVGPTPQANLNHPPHPHKQHPSLDSTGSSGGDSNTDLRSSNTPSPAASTEVLTRKVQSSGGVDYKQELEKFRKKRLQAVEKVEGARVESAMVRTDTTSPSLPRKAKTTSFGSTLSEAPSSSSSLSSHPGSIPSNTSTLDSVSTAHASLHPSSVSSDIASPTSLAAIKHPPGKRQPKFHSDTILEGEEADPSAAISNEKRGESLDMQSKQNKPEQVCCLSCHEVHSQRFKFCPMCGSSQSPGPPITQTSVPSLSPAASPTIVRASVEDTNLVEQAHRTKLLQLAGPGHEEQPEANIPVAAYESGNMSGVDQLRLKEEAFKRHQESQSYQHSRTPGGAMQGVTHGGHQGAVHGAPHGSHHGAAQDGYQGAQRVNQGSVQETSYSTNSGLSELKAKHEALRRGQEQCATQHTTPSTEESGMDQLRAKQEAYRQHQLKESQQALNKGSAHQEPQRKSHMEWNNESRYLHEQSGAGYSSTPLSRREEGQGIELLRKKEEAYKDSQRRKGVREADLERLPELMQAEKQMEAEKWKEAEKWREQGGGQQYRSWHQGEVDLQGPEKRVEPGAPRPKPRHQTPRQGEQGEMVPSQPRSRHEASRPSEQEDIAPPEPRPRHQATKQGGIAPPEPAPRIHGGMAPPQPKPRHQGDVATRQSQQQLDGGGSRRVGWRDVQPGPRDQGDLSEHEEVEPPLPKPRGQGSQRRKQDPEPPPMEPRKREQAPVPQSETKPEQRQCFKREDFLQNSYEEEICENSKIAALEMDGQSLLQCIKEGMVFGYSIGEVQTAFTACKARDDHTQWKDVARYLDTEWANMTRIVRERVAGLQYHEGASVGMPTEKEAREALVECQGKVEDAVAKIYHQRKEMVCALKQKMHTVRTVEPSLPELEWDSAVLALSRNGMDVEETFYAIQTEWLQPLYEYVYSEYTGVAKTDMEEIKKIIKNEQQYSLEARHRLLMAEYKFKECFRAEMVLGLIEQVEVDELSNYPLNYYVDAARDFDDLDTASNFLNKECPLCMDKNPIHEMVTMPGCTCSFCKTCFRINFEVAIKEKGVKHFNCPLCSLPNMVEREATEGLYVDIFVAMIRQHLDEHLYQLCNEKLNEFSLTKEPGFMWCPHNDCRSGFIYDADVARIPRDISCPNCKKRMCLMCKKPWEEQHAQCTCEQFAQWKQANDPDAQKQGLAAHLNANGIECPQCHMRYDLARGGCMHFRCTRCPNEFCSGCGQSFKLAQQCGKLKSCEKRGLHAHHPRDCLFYLRDFDVKELQEFLRQNKVEFDVEPPKEQVKAARKKMKKEGGEGEDGSSDEEDAGDGEVKLQCRVMLQKEIPEGLKDEECGKQVTDGQAGLCQLHYKEYLVDKINKNKLDPVTMYETDKILLILTREELEFPPHNADEEEEDDEEGETEEERREKLIKHVQRVLPLDTRPPAASAGLPEAPPPQPVQEMHVEDLDLAPA